MHENIIDVIVPMKGCVVMKWQVSLNNNSFDRAGITKDCQDAVCEYIWNGFEAGATQISVSLQGASMQEAMQLVVKDNGSGIPYKNLNETFGTFLSSLKNTSEIRIKSQSNKGKGRFSYLAFSSSAEWETIYEDEGQLKSYCIQTDSADKSRFETSQPVIATGASSTGTVVRFPLYDSKTTDQVSYLSIKKKLLEEFAWYLHLNKAKNYSLEYMGIPLDVSEYINTDLSKESTEKLGQYEFDINIVVWNSNVSNSSKIYYLTQSGEIVAVENTSFNKNKVGFYHAVFVSSAFFRVGMFFPQEDTGEQISIEGQDQTDPRPYLRDLKRMIAFIVSDVLKSFLTCQADLRMAEMERKGNYPVFSKDEYGKLRKKDFETVTRELYCVEPHIFYQLNDTQERSLLGFLNLLLSSDERENVLQIVEQVVSLTSEQRENFASILRRSKLQYIIDAVSIIERRVAVIEELKKIVFETCKFANERDHIQKIIEQHFWLFGEQYHMLTSDKNLSTSLREYEKITDCPGDTGFTMTTEDARQRADIFLYSQQVREDSTSEMLIIELKAPHVKLSLDVFNQIVRYANTIRKEPRFTSSNRTWRFFTVCAEVDDDVKVKYENFKQHGKKGLADIIGNFELYALSWDDVFQAFEARHSFMLEKLELDYSQVTEELGMSKGELKSKLEVTSLTQKLLTLKAQ